MSTLISKVMAERIGDFLNPASLHQSAAAMSFPPQAFTHMLLFIQKDGFEMIRVGLKSVPVRASRSTPGPSHRGSATTQAHTHVKSLSASLSYWIEGLPLQAIIDKKNPLKGAFPRGWDTSLDWGGNCHPCLLAVPPLPSHMRSSSRLSA